MDSTRILDEHIDQLTHVYRVAIDAAPVNAEIDRQLKDIGRTARIPGFRPGRAPLPVLRSRFGNQVREATVDRMGIDVARQVIAEKALQPIRRPEIGLASGAPAADGELVLELMVEVAPRFDAGELGGLTLQRLSTAAGGASESEQAQIHLRRQLFDALMARHDFPVPREMVEQERASIENGYRHEIGGPIDEALHAGFRDIAERRVRLAILLTETGRHHDIRLDREEVRTLIAAQAQGDEAQQAALIDYYLEHPSAMAELQSALFEDRVVAFLLERCEIEDVQVSAEEFDRALALP